MTEADTCREFVTPKIVEAGWGAAEPVMGEQRQRTAVEAAKPYWQTVEAEAERNSSLSIVKLLRGLEQAIGTAANSTKPALQTRLRALKAEQLAHVQSAKAAQTQDVAIYRPIYNLDSKNPNAKAVLEHFEPKDLIASMRGREAEVMRLLGEIEALVNEVQA